MALGFALTVVLAILVIVIGLGKVEEKTSFGLQFPLNGLVILASQFAVWCFMSKKEPKE